MHAIHFCTKAKGNLPHLYYILRKQDPLGEEFKTVTCYVTRALILIELQIGKEGMNNRNYQQDLGSTADWTEIMMEATKGIGQKYRKGGTKYFSLFEIWFYSNKAA